MSDLIPSESIHRLTPLETGGVEARHGFDVQDHVAAGYLISMLSTPSLTQVWCETHDDITLIWKGTCGEEVEFVQVKSNELDQLWSVAKLCDRERTRARPDGLGTSILERSLANDRCSEPCRFRIVTCRPVQEELELLTYPLASECRVADCNRLQRLDAEIGKRVGPFRSPNGNGHSSWLSRSVWDVRHSLDSISNHNLLLLRTVIEARGAVVFSDQVEEIYSAFLSKARQAAVADWRINPAIKKICQDGLLEWFQKLLESAAHPAGERGAGTKLREKMEMARLSTDTIEAAMDQRRRYREEVLKPQYLKVSERRLAEGEVLASLQCLKAQLDAGEIADNGVEFHALCLKRLGELQETIRPAIRPPVSFLYGCMYSVTDRCLHRFRRATA